MTSKKDITIYDIAKKLGLSTATVSRALQNSEAISKKTRKRIQDTAEELGYRRNTFASSLRKQNTNTIGVLVHELNSNFITSVLAGIEMATTEAGYDLLIAHSSENAVKEAANAKNLFHKRVDGLIASLAFNTKTLDHFKPFTEKGIPVVFFDRAEEKDDYTKVIIDNYKCGYAATQHLIDQGCKTVAMINGNIQRNVYSERYRGYKDALAANKIPFQKKLIFNNPLNEESSIEAAKEIFNLKPRPDGVFITNDFSAANCIKVWKEKGLKVPEDIAVVGFNNDVIGKIIEPQLSTINYPGKEMGEIAARNLIAQLKGHQTPINTIIIQSELIIRASSLKSKN